MDNYKILVVDDLVENLKVLISILSEHFPDSKIYQTIDSRKATQIAEQIVPDLIITDWDMPKLSGLEMIKQLKNNLVTQEIPVVMVTGKMTTTTHLKQALEAGAIDYVRTPVEPVELIARAKAALMITSYYKQIVEQKKRELAESSLSMVKNHENANHFASELDKVKNLIEEKPVLAKQEINKIKRELVQYNDQSSWERFQISFSEVHPDFSRNITEKHPLLTPSELKLSSFIRLSMSNKEIASILHQSTDSIKVSRYRLRKKLNLEQGVNFETYLSQF